MTSRIRASRLFISAMILLCISGIASNLSFSYLRVSEGWVTHTQEVRAVLGDLEAATGSAARARMSFLISGSLADLDDYRKAVLRVPGEMSRLRYLTKDNPIQINNCRQLESLTNERLRSWEDTISAKTLGRPLDMTAFLEKNVRSASQTAAVGDAIRNEEGRLLQERTRTAQRHFALVSVSVISSLILAILLLYLQYRLLVTELRARESAEKAVRTAYEHEATLRKDRDRFRLFVEAVKDYAIYVLDDSGSVVTWNRGAERFKGYKAAEIIGQNFSCFFTPEDIRDGKPQKEMETAANEGQFQGEGWRIRKDGTQFWANIVLTAVKNEQGKLEGFVKVTRDFTERMRLQESLRITNIELVDQIEERKAAQKKLAGSESALRQLSLHLLRTQDEERRRIGRELHDSLGQYLAVLKINLDSLKSSWGETQNGAGKQIAQCIRLTEDSIKEVRTISYLLYPPTLEEVGLKSAVPWYLEGFSERSSIKTTFETDPNLGRLGRDVELALFRVLQETLTNVHRHSGSATADIRLSRRNDLVVMEIKDKGRGISPRLLEEAGKDWLGSLGVGLRGMNERIRQLGGTLEVSSDENGTVVTATVPIEEPTAIFPDSLPA
jgi:PAS domain S-box-containing protein